MTPFCFALLVLAAAESEFTCKLNSAHELVRYPAWIKDTAYGCDAYINATPLAVRANGVYTSTNDTYCAWMNDLTQETLRNGITCRRAMTPDAYAYSIEFRLNTGMLALLVTSLFLIYYLKLG